MRTQEKNSAEEIDTQLAPESRRDRISLQWEENPGWRRVEKNEGLEEKGDTLVHVPSANGKYGEVGLFCLNLWESWTISLTSCHVQANVW